jgi:hypothetical protein
VTAGCPAADRVSLPGRTVDLIRDGAPAADLARRGDSAVWSALLSTATSARQRGWTFPEWAAYVSEARSNLGRQARIKRGRTELTRAQ